MTTDNETLQEYAKRRDKLYHERNPKSTKTYEEAMQEAFEKKHALESQNLVVEKRDFEECITEEFGDEILPEGTEKTNQKPRITKTRQFMEYALDNGISSFQKLTERPREEWIGWYSMPNFNAVAGNTYDLVKNTFRNYKVIPDIEKLIKKETEYNGFNKIQKLLEFHGWSEHQINFFGFVLLAVSDQKLKKKNTIFLSGKASAGKSALSESWVRSFFETSWGQPDNNLRTAFKWNDCTNVRMILWEEPKINSDCIEDVKKITGGQAHVVNAKYKSGVEIPSTPVIMTSNQSLYLCSSGQDDAMKTRCFEFTFTKQIDENTAFAIDFPITKEDWIEFYKSKPELVQMAKRGKYQSAKRKLEFSEEVLEEENVNAKRLKQ